MEIFKKIFIIGVQIFDYGRNILKIFFEILFKCAQFFLSFYMELRKILIFLSDIGFLHFSFQPWQFCFKLEAKYVSNKLQFPGEFFFFFCNEKVRVVLTYVLVNTNEYLEKDHPVSNSFALFIEHLFMERDFPEPTVRWGLFQGVYCSDQDLS